MNEHAQVLTTTLNRLHAANACVPRYAHLLAALGGPSADHDAPINLLTILEHNGLDDCLWALCATTENCDTVARLMAADFAELAMPIYERDYPSDTRPRNAIAAARGYALGTTAAGDAASAARAANEAVWAATWASSRAAASAAASAASAVWADARASSRAADWAARSARAASAASDAARAAQEKILRGYLLPGGTNA